MSQLCNHVGCCGPDGLAPGPDFNAAILVAVVIALVFMVIVL
jgi:hypothetical protein